VDSKLELPTIHGKLSLLGTESHRKKRGRDKVQRIFGETEERKGMGR